VSRERRGLLEITVKRRNISRPLVVVVMRRKVFRK
jgi:hypothetical protein